VLKSLKFAIALIFIAGTIAALASETLGYPPMLVKAKKFGAKDCTFCHVDPEGGPPWNERGQWLIKEKERRAAETVEVEWLADYKPGQAQDKKAEPGKGEEKLEPAKQDRPSDSVESQLLKLEREWLDAYLNRDVAAMERIEADEFTITHGNGQVLSKAQEIANLKSAGPKDPAEAFSTEEVKVRIYGDAAVLTGIVVMKNARGTQRSRYTDVYIKRDGRWQVAASHLTSLPPGK
jgi:ketosteroid isomerase-like protein